MTRDFENMLYLFGANATGNKVKLKEPINVEQIRKYAIEQGIWTMVYPELAKVCDASKYQLECFSMISKGISQREYTLGIIRKIEKAGIKCCILKGVTLSGIYAEPECRISSDTDILINPKDERRIVKLLKDYGYVVESRAKTYHHIKAYHKCGGILEVHVMLYSNPTSKIIFDGLQMYNEQWSKIKINGCEYNVLGYNDGLVYLTAHYIKHFINSGGGVRQMMDLLLYLQNYKDKLDMVSYDRLLHKLKYNKLISAVKTVGAKYFGFDYEIKHEELSERILNDTELGGIFGYSTDARNGFYDSYCKNRTSMSKYVFKLFMMSKDDKGLKDRFFPNKKTMVNVFGYKYAKNSLLIPFAWLNRLFALLLKRLRTSNTKVANKEFDDRMNLMKDLGMIGE